MTVFEQPVSKSSGQLHYTRQSRTTRLKSGPLGNLRLRPGATTIATPIVIDKQTGEAFEWG